MSIIEHHLEQAQWAHNEIIYELEFSRTEVKELQKQLVIAESALHSISVDGKDGTITIEQYLFELRLTAEKALSLLQLRRTKDQAP